MGPQVYHSMGDNIAKVKATDGIRFIAGVVEEATVVTVDGDLNTDASEWRTRLWQLFQHQSLRVQVGQLW